MEITDLEKFANDPVRASVNHHFNRAAGSLKMMVKLRAWKEIRGLMKFLKRAQWENEPVAEPERQRNSLRIIDGGRK